MGVADLTVQMVLIVVIGVFLASFTDAIAGGGGIISVPTYLLAGLPMHYALGTNKFSSAIGTAVSTGRYVKSGYVDWKLGLPSIVLALVGAYDGFYGPGTGTFLLLIFCNLAKLDVRTAGGNVKLVNLASNIGALATSFMSGKVFLLLGLIGTASSILGHFIGSGLAIKNGSKIVRPTVIVVLLLLAAKVVQGLLTG